MIDSPARILRQYMTDSGLAVSPTVARNDDWPVINGMLPNDGDNFIGILNTGARTQGRIQQTGEHIQHPKVQVMVRGVDDETAYSQSKYIEQQLSKVGVAPPLGVGRQCVRILNRRYVLSAVHVAIPATLVSREPNSRRYIYSINLVVKTVYQLPMPVEGSPMGLLLGITYP